MKTKQDSKSLCIRCKKNPKAEGFSNCHPCREYCSNKGKEKRLERINSGKCSRCGGEKTGIYKDKLDCEKCVNLLKKRKKNYREKLSKNGFCDRCYKNKVVKGMSKCVQCLENQKNHRYDRKQNGLCIECGDKLHTKSLCFNCLSKRKQKIFDRRRVRAVKILKTLKKRKSKQGKDPYGFIYKAICQDNNKIYVGQTIDFDKRQIKHVRDAFNQKTGTPFARALRKHGKDNFKWEVIHDCYDKKELNYWEWHYINKFDSFSYKNGYNVLDGVLN